MQGAATRAAHPPAQAEGGLKVFENIVSFSSSTSARRRATSCMAGRQVNEWW